jgi:hypothetical protein
LDHWLDVWNIVLLVEVVLLPRVVVVVLVLLVLLDPLWHWRQGHSLRKVGQRVDELSSFSVGVVERAAISELALSCGLPVLAWLSLVVRVNCAKSGLSKMLWKRVIWLSQLFRSVSELAVLSKWALA